MSRSARPPAFGGGAVLAPGSAVAESSGATVPSLLYFTFGVSSTISLLSPRIMLGSKCSTADGDRRPRTLAAATMPNGTSSSDEAFGV